MLDPLQFYCQVLCNGMKTRFRMVMIAHPGPGIGFHKRFMWQIIIPPTTSTFSPLWGFGIVIALAARVTTLVLTLPVLVHQLLGLGTTRTRCNSRGQLRVQCLGLFATLTHYLLWYLLYCAIVFTIIHCGQCMRMHNSLLPQLLGHAGAGRRRRKGGDWDFMWALYMLFNTKMKT